MLLYRLNHNRVQEIYEWDLPLITPIRFVKIEQSKEYNVSSLFRASTRLVAVGLFLPPPSTGVKRLPFGKPHICDVCCS